MTRSTRITKARLARSSAKTRMGMRKGLKSWPLKKTPSSRAGTRKTRTASWTRSKPRKGRCTHPTQPPLPRFSKTETKERETCTWTSTGYAKPKRLDCWRRVRVAPFPNPADCLPHLVECTTRDVRSIASASNIYWRTGNSYECITSALFAHTQHAHTRRLTLFFFTLRASGTVRQKRRPHLGAWRGEALRRGWGGITAGGDANLARQEPCFRRDKRGELGGEALGGVRVGEASREGLVFLVV